MIPALLDDSTRSPGERDIFDLLKNDPLTSAWTVLHSLLLPDHATQISGEVDFIVIVPGLGVLCVEVKGCYSLHVAGGSWYYGNSTTPDPRGPFKQASNGMHAIRQRLSELLPSSRHILFWSAVIFPYLPFDMPAREWHPWQAIDREEIRRVGLARSIETVLRRARGFLSTKPNAEWFRANQGSPTEAECAAVARTLRPEFEVMETPRAARRRRDGARVAFSEEQFEVLDTYDDDRVLVHGPAGTGKTVLAMELARRSVISKRRTGLFCYNRLLGQELSKYARDRAPVAFAGTLHKYMLTLTGESVLARTSEPGFWDRGLPERAAERLIEQSHGPVFDELIIDEAQDLFSSHYLDFFDLCLLGGLGAGRWRAFGDFERQAVFGPVLDARQTLHTLNVGFSSCDLRINCRNTPRIAALVEQLGRLDPGYRRVRRPDDQLHPTLRYYTNAGEQGDALVETLQGLYTDGWRGDEIIVLSPRATGCAAAAVSAEPWRSRLKPLHAAGRGEVPFTTIHAFKGLERSAVIVTDVDDLPSAQAERLLYVGTTRALDRLTILLPESQKGEVIRRLLRTSED